jgi:DNA-binding XRE family transcriptional regulator
LMSMNSELRARFEPRAPVRDADPPPSFSGELIPLVLRNEGSLHEPITVVHRLRAAGLSLRAAYAIITRLAEAGLAVCRVAEGADIPTLARDLLALGVRVYRRRALDPGLVAEVRSRHGLSQREFAEILGLDTDTLQNWEQGRNKPDAAALKLVLAYDRDPEVITAAALEPVC